jgi:predicted glycosyltransferase
MKEMSYLSTDELFDREPANGCFFRVTRTDSVHHSPESRIDLFRVVKLMNNLTKKYSCILSSELHSLPEISDQIALANITAVHTQLRNCRVFWGNSATMAAEAVLLGVPAIYVGAEKFSYLIELEEYGLLKCFHPGDLESSFEELRKLLLSNSHHSPYKEALLKLKEDKIDMTRFLVWFIVNLPESPVILHENPEVKLNFRL